MSASTLPLLAPKMLFRSRNDPKKELHRIVWTGRQSHYTFFVSLSEEGWPEAYETEQLRERFSPDYKGEDALEFVLEDPYALKLRIDPSDEAYERMQWIADLVEGDALFDILVPSKRGRAIKAQVKKVGKSRPTISLHVKRFLARGMSASALQGDRENCGAPGMGRNPTKKTGRRRKTKAGIGTPVNDSNRAILEVAACYAAVGKRTLQQGLDYINQHHCRDWSVDARFTTDQLRYHIRKTRPVTQQIREKRGERHLNLKRRAFVGKTYAYGPGAEFQIDATIGDVYLVSVFNRAKVIGRPTIYIVSDTFSRLIVGVSISLSPPSIEGAALAMESVITPKVLLCHEFGIEAKEEWWPSHHLPKKILADRGSEFISIRAWERVVNRLRIDVNNTAAFRPDWKSIVESRFNLVAAIWGESVPGYVEKDFQERGGEDYRLDAALTLHEFTALFMISVIEYNNRPLRTKEQIPEMVAADLIPTPVELWNFGVAEYSGILDMANIDEMRACVYTRDRASVSHRGIGYANRFYETPRAVKEEWFTRARTGKFMVDISYNPINPRNLYVLYDDGKFELASIRETTVQLRDVDASYVEIDALRVDAARNLSDAFDKTENLKLKLRDMADEIIDGAKEKTKLAMERLGVRKPEINEIRNAKAEERALLEFIRANGQLTDLTEMSVQSSVGESSDCESGEINSISLESIRKMKARQREKGK
ncbi:DDE-type integrase/transposase/recombinase [Cupriavidus taiwanensis]|uniref:DDE-type integrase/transposase/recombinase n=1 Tax=Cupriavidus taiwanensis TaxID=164546 RepID=UPI0018DE7EAB|nr:DDE-type integrase/transposase/recombinase [Cupriavidus taiwanensis]